MPRVKQIAKVTSFLKGRISEANPVDFPADALLSEKNFVLNRDGTADRRLGMDKEVSGESLVTSVLSSSREGYAVSTFEWEKAGGIANTVLVVVQLGSTLSFYDRSINPLSDGYLSTHSLGSSVGTRVDYAEVDGELIVASGEKDLVIFNWDGTTVTSRTDYLLIRDIFGVEDIDTDTSKDLFSPSDVSYRPTVLTDAHLYNLRNQSWGPAISNFGRTTWDPIEEFYGRDSYGLFPSNADNVAEGLKVNPDSDPPREVFTARFLHDNDPFRVEAPKGYFIIDALERGSSREAEHDNNYSNTQNRNSNNTSGSNRNLSYQFSGTGLPTDRTPGGATCVANFAGRAVYGGFSSQIEDGDGRSPKLGSYLLISRVVRHPEDITKCYQDGDPTSRDTPDVVATDGLIVRVNGAVNIQKLIPLGKRLFILAENGIWSLSGDTGGGFSAEQFELEALSTTGTTKKGSIVEADGAIYYWADDGIYRIQSNEVGEYGIVNLTEQTIKSYYLNADDSSVTGTFDEFERKIYWLHGDKSTGASVAGEELVYDTITGGFASTEIQKIAGTSYPIVMDYIKVGVFATGTNSVEVTETDGTVVTDTGGGDVTIDTVIRTSGIRSTKYLSFLESDGNYELMYFTQYNNTDFLDWYSVDGVGVDAAAHLTMGYMTADEIARMKQAPNITIHFDRTEQGFELVDEGTGEIGFDNPSSCLLQFQWDWADADSSNKWSVARQAYRLGRYVLPASVSDPFDYGFSTIITRNRVRGRGRAISVNLSTEPGYDCRVLGYSIDIHTNEES